MTQDDLRELFMERVAKPGQPDHFTRIPLVQHYKERVEQKE